MSDVRRTKDDRKCLYCEKYFDIVKEEFVKPRTNRYAHKVCAEKYGSTDDAYIDRIYKYLKEEVKINYDYPACESQRISFVKKMEYTNKGIYLALKYFYEIKKESAAKSGNRIGIVPYVYDEAQAYYENLAYKQVKVAEVVEKQKKEKPIIIRITAPEQRKERPHINLNEIGGELVGR